MTPPEERKRLLLTQEALLPLSIVVGLVVAVAGGSAWVVSTVRDLRYGIDALTTEMRAKTAAGDERDVELRKILDGTIRRTEFAMWVDLVRAKNPTVTLPDMPH